MVALTTPSFFKKNLDFRTLLPYSLTMTIAELKEIIDMNADAAESGCHQAQGQVIEAQAEIERLEREAEEAARDEWCEGAGVPHIDEFPALSPADLAAIERDEAEVARRVAEARERAEFGGFTREELTDFSMLTEDELKGDW